MAFAQALALEETVVPLLHERKGLLSRQDLSAYEHRYESIVRPYYQMTNFVLWLSRHPIVSELVVRLLGYDTAVFQTLLSANMGLIPLWQATGKSLRVR